MQQKMITLLFVFNMKVIKIGKCYKVTVISWFIVGGVLISNVNIEIVNVQMCTIKDRIYATWHVCWSTKFKTSDSSILRKFVSNCLSCIVVTFSLFAGSWSAKETMFSSAVASCSWTNICMSTSCKSSSSSTGEGGDRFLRHKGRHWWPVQFKMWNCILLVRHQILGGGLRQLTLFP